jgi:hypothetical protein
MLKWLVGIMVVLGLVGYCLINDEAILRKGLERVKTEEGVTTGDDFLRFKYDTNNTAAYLERFTGPLDWRCKLVSVSLAFGEYELVHEIATQAKEIHKEGPLANSPQMQELAWANAHGLDMLGKVNDSKDAMRDLLKDYPDHPKAAAAKQRLAELETMYH